jgi:hypothetical protein
MLTLFIRLMALLALVSTLGACAAKAPPLYSWQGYQANLDAYFRGTSLSPDAQAQLMEQDLQKIQGSGSAVPPGYHAHLGLLYAERGDLDKFAQQVQLEKNKFPESQPFMDFLLRNFKK